MKIGINKYIVILTIIFLAFCSSIHAQTISDKEVIKNVTSLKGAASSISRLEPIQYEYKTDQYKHLDLPSGTHYGLVAQDVQGVYPSAVKTNHKSYPAGKNFYKTASLKTVDYESLIPILIAAVKQQQHEIEYLRKEINDLKAAVE